MNRGLMTTLVAIGAAQLLKIPVQYARTNTWSVNRLTGSGGMPSSHSSGVSALSVYTAIRHGIKTPEFAISAVLGIIVMYDAMNLRLNTGKISKQVNDLDVDVERLTGHHPGIHHVRREKKLEESIGHMPEEVLAGAVVGGLIGAAGALTAR